jgi:hypothetical protein
MGRWSVAHRTAAVRFYYKTKSVIWTQHRMRKQFNVPRHGEIASRNRILLWIHKFEDTGSFHCAPSTVHTEMLAEQGNHFNTVHVAQFHNIEASGHKQKFGRVLQEDHTAAWTWSTISTIRLFLVLETSCGQHVHQTSRYQTSFCANIWKNEYTELAPTQHRT